ncbi:Tat (twin-arginine translocation) pathway signal sequence [Catalinimonas alkaloidigena]|uniref:Tat (Twin-arginine translocation) pathway signal sequence n=1 Tax=Catalinimonas alkaloidigena TaxID=1075417 RepID=A0A1G9GMC4_9BACT|nr:Gfo/Idh/MocA family oxidoreductase [Catalinimonas alkaloidigena]SDL01443.1 Tat (twin-arginine translocation) pathway signal sequence [Catalinimonas alkaloidigena]
MHPNRRHFLKHSLTTAAAGVAATALPHDLFGAPTSRYRELRAPRRRPVQPKESIRFSVIGLNHGHIYGQVESLLEGGGQLVSVYAKEADLLKDFTKRYPNAKVAQSEKEILEDKSIQLVASAAIPVERAPLGIRVMQHGKDYMVDKPGIITLEQLEAVKRVQRETQRIYSIMYSERMRNPATVHAGELVQAGAIGQVVQTLGMGPHRMRPETRPDWFFDPAKFGGILCDIGSHQSDQFLFFTGSTTGEVISSQVGNFNNPKYPQFEDFGDMHVRGNQGTGYIRIDWFTPDGLPTWGDGRLTILGTDGYIELRKYVDIAGREGGDHLFLVDQKEVKYIDCSDVHMPYGEQLVHDVVHRTETAMTQAHCFLATELALNAQKKAYRFNL